MSWRGLAERGRPPFLTTALASMSSVNSGSSLYSAGLIRCASTRARSEPEVRREAFFLTVVGLSHAEDVAHRATRGKADHYEPALQPSVADDPAFTVILSKVLDFDGNATEYKDGILEIQSTLPQGPCSLCRIVADSHPIIVSTITAPRQHRVCQRLCASLVHHRSKSAEGRPRPAEASALRPAMPTP